MRRTLPTVIVGTIVAAVAVAAPQASAEAEGQPGVAVAVDAGFTVGAQISASDLSDDDPWNDYTTDIPETVRWSGDPETVCGYDVNRLYAGMAPDRLVSWTQTTELADMLSDYNGDLGGGSNVATGWQVVATDCGGGAPASATLRSAPVVVQEDGRSATAWSIPEITYGGSWSTSRCGCASGATQTYTRQKGAAVSITQEFSAGDHAALVMAQGPGRGKADVLVDGTLEQVVDTHAHSNVNRVIVFDRSMSAGTHTIEVVNQATPGHGRVDLDAVLVQ